MLQVYYFFFLYDTTTTYIYTLSLHDALPISLFYDRRPTERGTAFAMRAPSRTPPPGTHLYRCSRIVQRGPLNRSEEHTSELQSQSNLVCRLLLEKKKIYRRTTFLLHASVLQR